MNIVSKLVDETATVEDVKYLLWLSLIELQSYSPEGTIAVDAEESFDINTLVDILSD